MTRRRQAHRGFTLVELMVAMTLLLLFLSAILPFVASLQASFQAQGEAADMHQRLRAGVDLLAAELRAAQGVRPYRVGNVRDDTALGVFFRPDALAVVGVPESPTTPEVLAARTYYLKSDPATDTFTLMQYDGRVTDMPLVDHVVRLAWQYFSTSSLDGTLERIDPALLVDGPWLQDNSGRQFDGDLLRVREVRLTLRVESADASLRGRAGAWFARSGTSNAAGRYLPDEELHVHVALRNARSPQ